MSQSPADPEPNDPHLPLRQDVKMLGRLLGQVLEEQEGKPFLEKIESLRSLSKSAQDDPKAFSELQKNLGELPVSEAVSVARAFSHFLSLANVAEQHHRTRRRRAHLTSHFTEEKKAQRGSLRESISRLLQAGHSKDQILKQICQQNVELVLTAHPTEVSRKSFLKKYYQIGEALDQLDLPMRTPLEIHEASETIKRKILSGWKTNEIRRSKPTPIEEARGGLHFFDLTLWETIPRFLKALDLVMEEKLGRPLPVNCTPFSFASWIGGDRDGNPNVTPEVTRQVVAQNRDFAFELFYQDLRELSNELTLRSGNEELQKIAEDSPHPYRVVLEDTIDLLRSKSEKLTKEKFLQKLELCYRSLCDTGAELIARGRLLDIIRRVHVFGLNLLRLDIREDSEKHTQAIDALSHAVGEGSFTEKDEKDRQAYLIEKLKADKIPPAISNLDFENLDDTARRVLNTFKVVAELGVRSFGAAIISMARQPSDVLAVAYLQRISGIKEGMRIVPLFETLDDLSSAGQTLDRLFRTEWYRQLIREKFGDRQEIMLGYSDSTKDAGRLAAAWALYESQEKILKVGEEHGVEITFFHGRGGTVGRGGGPTHLAIQSQPPGTLKGKLRVTEQGEMIHAKFGLPDIAFRTLELYTTATLETSMAPATPPKSEWRHLMSQIAKTSCDDYRKTVRGNEKFVEYFRSVTPEPHLSHLKIGSRPAKRKKSGGVESLRAIPWIMAWTQTRLLLPSWLGTAPALSSALDGANRETLFEMYREWPFFRSTLDLIEMVLAKASPQIANAYHQILSPHELDDFGKELAQKFENTKKALLEVTHQNQLLEKNSVLRRSIGVRNPYVDPINLVQIEVLRRLQTRDEPDSDLLDALLITINGIAAGMRNTG